MKSSYKRHIVIASAFALFISCGQSVFAGWFGASVKPDPSITLFGQTLTVPIPSLVVGKAAGTSFDASACSVKGASLTLPWIKVGVQSPKLTVGIKDAKVSLSTNGIKKAGKKAKK